MPAALRLTNSIEEILKFASNPLAFKEWMPGVRSIEAMGRRTSSDGVELILYHLRRVNLGHLTLVVFEYNRKTEMSWEVYALALGALVPETGYSILFQLVDHGEYRALTGTFDYPKGLKPWIGLPLKLAVERAIQSDFKQLQEFLKAQSS